MSATSAFPTFTGSFASGFFADAFMATNVITIATARTMIDQTASFFLRFPLIELSSIRYCERKRPRRAKVSGRDRRRTDDIDIIGTVLTHDCIRVNRAASRIAV